MKKWILLIVSIVVLVAVICVSRFVLDNTRPTITVNSTPVLACNISKDDLLTYAQASDNNLKSFFIEEDDLLNIADTGKLTYVAVDNSNNVTRKTVSVDVDPDLTNYEIKIIAPLELQLNSKVVGEKYFKLVNACGQEVSDSFYIKGIDVKNSGNYEVTVSARKHDADRLHVVFTVADYKSPKISLRENEVHEYPDTEFDDAYFINLIDNIQDDNDTSPSLVKNVITNFANVLKPNVETGLLDEGSYTVTYYVVDSDGNTGRANLKVKIEE